MTAPAPQYTCWLRIREPIDGGAFYTGWTGWAMTTINFVFMDVSTTPPTTLGVFNAWSADMPLISRIDDLDGTTDSQRARVQSDFIALVGGTYTLINSSDPVLPEDGSYPYYDPGWFPVWLMNSGPITGLTADQMKFVWV